MTKLSKVDVERIVALYTTPNGDGTYPKQSEIAPLFDVSTATIGRALNAAGISGADRQGSNNRKLAPADIERIVELYTTQLPDGTLRSSHEIADQFGVTHPAVLYHLRRQGVEIRTAGETQSGRTYSVANRPPEDERAPLCKCGCGKDVGWDGNHRRWRKYCDGHYHPNRRYHDEDWLRREYVDRKRPATEIAAEFDVIPQTIYKFLRKFGIERRTTGESLELSGAMRGENNPAWNGGVADWDYAYNWKSICKRIKDRDKWTCQFCGEQRKRWGHKLHVHHINGDKTDNRDENLVALCSSCHRRVHADDGAAQELIELIHI